MEFSIIIPVYNEEKNIVEAMRRIHAFMSLKNKPWECLIVDDGSTDTTVSVAQKEMAEHAYKDFRILPNQVNHGKGFVVRQGVLECSGRFVLVTDADLSAPIKELEKLTAALEEGYDVAIGSRSVHAPGGDVQQTFKRWLAGRIFNIFVQLLALRGISDSQCGFKCFKKEAAQTLFKKQKLDGFSFDVEILRRAQKDGLKIKEVSVMWRQGQATRVRFFQDSLKMLRDLFIIRKIS